MCVYIQQIPLCGHPPPTLIEYASCTAVLDQLMRINDPASWEPDTIGTVPFDLPHDCDPNPHNIYVCYTEDYCGWECRNNHTTMMAIAAGFERSPSPEMGPMGRRDMYQGYGAGYDRAGASWAAAGPRGEMLGSRGRNRRPKVMGMPNASYGPGSERRGIGWRTD